MLKLSLLTTQKKDRQKPLEKMLFFAVMLESVLFFANTVGFFAMKLWKMADSSSFHFALTLGLTEIALLTQLEAALLASQDSPQVPQPPPFF